eukprot:440744-Pleurochrysis_carterae.AAC.4
MCACVPHIQRSSPSEPALALRMKLYLLANSCQHNGTVPNNNKDRCRADCMAASPRSFWPQSDALRAYSRTSRPTRLSVCSCALR